MNIIRASHLGMCFGVRDAIALALDTPGPLTIFGDLVHNEAVLKDLRSHGVRLEHWLDRVESPTVMITAHGASDRALDRIRSRGLAVVEATCPLVQVVHRAARRLASEGFHPVIIGKRDHVEVRGIIEDLAEYDVVHSEEDVAALPEHARFGVVAQTTQPIDRAQRLVRLLQERFPNSEVRFIDTVCQPTKQRQTAAVELALRSDVVVVVGGAGSNNTRELVATCARYCARVHQVETADDLRPCWFGGAETVGLTAGTSTPDAVIDAVEARLRTIAAPGDAAVETAVPAQEPHANSMAAQAT